MTIQTFSRHDLDVKITDLLEANGLFLSPVEFNAQRTPDTQMDGAFTVLMTARNNLQDRERRYQTVEEDVLIRMMHRIPPHNQFEAKREAYRDEEKVLKALLNKANLPYVNPAHHVNTRHQEVAGGAYLMTDINLRLTHYIDLE